MSRPTIMAVAGVAAALLTSGAVLAGSEPERPARLTASAADFYAQSLKAVTDDSAGLQRRTWAVVLDVDDSVLDNTGTAISGAATFLHAVRAELRGRIVLVTHRSKDQCPGTEANLRKEKLEYDAILCEENSSRLRRIQQSGVAGLGPLTVVAYLGNKPQDFRSLSQSLAGDTPRFASRYSLTVDPMFGSWREMLKR